MDRFKYTTREKLSTIMPLGVHELYLIVPNERVESSTSGLFGMPRRHLSGEVGICCDAQQRNGIKCLSDDL